MPLGPRQYTFKETGVKLDVLNPLESRQKKQPRPVRTIYLRDGEKPPGFETNNRPRRTRNRTREGRKYQTVHNGYFEDADVRTAP